MTAASPDIIRACVFDADGALSRLRSDEPAAAGAG
jgi:hypothetical protein